MTINNIIFDFIKRKWRDKDSRGILLSMISVVHFSIGFGILLSFGEFIPVLKGSITNNETSLGLISSLSLFFAFSMAPFSTFLTDRLRTRKSLLVTISFASVTLAFTGAVSNLWWVMIFFGVLFGSSMAILTNPHFFLCNDYFPFHHKRHVVATSLMTCGFPLGSLIFNPITYYFIANYGWNTAFAANAIIAIVVIAPTSLLMVEVSDVQNNEDSDEEEKKSIIEHEEDAKTSGMKLKVSTRLIVGSIWLMANLLKSVAYSAPFMFLVHYMTKNGIPQGKASLGMTLMSTCEFFSRLASSYFGDKLKGKFILAYVIFSFILSVVNFLGSFTHNFPTIIIYAISLGIFDGPIIAVLLSSCIELHDGYHLNETFSIFRLGMGVGYLIGPTLSGFLYDYYGSFKPIFYTTSLAYFLSSCCYALCLLLRKYKKSWWIPEKVENIEMNNPSTSQQ